MPQMQGFVGKCFAASTIAMSMPARLGYRLRSSVAVQLSTSTHPDSAISQAEGLAETLVLRKTDEIGYSTFARWGNTSHGPPQLKTPIVEQLLTQFWRFVDCRSSILSITAICWRVPRVPSVPPFRAIRVHRWIALPSGRSRSSVHSRASLDRDDRFG